MGVTKATDARSAALSAVDRLFAFSSGATSTAAPPPAKKLQTILHEAPVLKAVQAVASTTLSGNDAARPNATAKELARAGILPVNAKGIVGRTDAHRGLKPVRQDGAVVVEGNPAANNASLSLASSLSKEVDVAGEAATAIAGKKRKRAAATGPDSLIAGLAADPDAPVLRYAAEAGIDVAAVTDARRNGGRSAKRQKRSDGGDDAEGAQQTATTTTTAGPAPLPPPRLTAPVAKALANAAPLLAGGGGLLGDKGVTAPKLFDESRRGPGAASKGNGVDSDRVSKSGAKWFNLQGTELTKEVRRDLLILRHRGYLDPKRHYKGGGLDGDKSPMALPKFFQMGTVVEGAHESMSKASKLSKKERKGTLVEALLADERIRAYAKKNYLEVAAQASAGGKHAYRQRKAMMAPKALQEAAYNRAFTKSRKKKGHH